MPTINDNTTSVQIDILSSWFWIDRVYENTIKANSLPLNIYKSDTDYKQYEGDAASLYHSFVEPSIASEFDTANAENEYYH